MVCPRSWDFGSSWSISQTHLENYYIVLQLWYSFSCLWSTRTSPSSSWRGGLAKGVFLWGSREQHTPVLPGHLYATTRTQCVYWERHTLQFQSDSFLPSREYAGLSWGSWIAWQDQSQWDKRRMVSSIQSRNYLVWCLCVRSGWLERVQFAPTSRWGTWGRSSE